MRYASLFDPFTGKENIDNQEKYKFLHSPAYCNMLRKMVVGLTSDHRLTVYILPEDDPELGYTDGERVMINTMHQLFEGETIEKITEFCLALAVHESLHPLYSCFQCITDAAKKKAYETDNFVYVRRQIFNILEDARIERIGAFKFPGVSYAIESLNEFLYAKPVDMTKAKDIEILMKWLLDFVSVDKVRSELTGEIGRLFEKIKPLAILAKYSDTCSGCYFYTKKIMKLIKDIISENEPLEKQTPKTDTAQGNAVDVDAGTGQVPPNAQLGKGNGKGKGKGQGQPQAQNQCQGNGQGQGNGGQNQDANQGCGGGSDQGNNPRGKGGKGASVLEERLNQALNSTFQEHKQDQADSADDRKTAASLSGDSTAEYKVISVHGSYENMDFYSRVRSEVTPITNKLRIGLKDIINYNVDEMCRYMHTGRIDPKSLSRIPSGAICAKRIEKNEEADLNITVLVDLSGSMGGWNIENAIKACIVLYEVCMALGIPITILGFKDGHKGAVQIFHFANRMFKGRFSHTGIVKMTAGGGTPLNPALRYIPRLLQKQAEEDKLVIVITDGEPNEPAEVCDQSVRIIAQNAKVYGLAIGGGHEALARIFGKNCIVVDKLEMLPRELCRIVEKNIIRRN